MDTRRFQCFYMFKKTLCTTSLLQIITYANCITGKVSEVRVVDKNVEKLKNEEVED